MALGAAALVMTTGAMAQDRGAKGPMRGMQIDFSALDTNGGGQISTQELNAQTRARFDAIDTNGDGTISAEEMTAHREAERAARAERMQARVIERLDTDGDGAISFEEMAAVSRHDRLIERLDTDGDGMISQAELEAAHARTNHRGEGRNAQE